MTEFYFPLLFFVCFFLASLAYKNQHFWEGACRVCNKNITMQLYKAKKIELQMQSKKVKQKLQQ